MAKDDGDTLRNQIEHRLDELRRIRDEIRVDMHLASMDAKDKWRELEPRVRDVETMAKDITDASRKALEEVIGSVRRFRESLSPPHHPPR